MPAAGGLPRQDLTEDVAERESWPLIQARGFRDYDARWLFGSEINLVGLQRVGQALGELLRRHGTPLRVVTGHDFRSSSCAVKMALTSGLMASGCDVHDIGLCLTPTAYFAQFALDVPAVAMVTASHNPKGWTGLKMGMAPPLTFGPEEMAELRAIALRETVEHHAGGRLLRHPDISRHYVDDLVKDGPLRAPFTVVVACGNGTAGAFAPEVLRRLGCTVIEVDCRLDHSFPSYNPNPEDVRMLRVMADAVTRHGADLAFGFDGDGDRLGIVDDAGRILLADKAGLLLARWLAPLQGDSRFVVDSKSTGLYARDPVLRASGVEVEYFKTGHSHMKRRVQELGAVAGFEKSGHFFFGPPHGRGYDDALLSAVMMCRLLDEARRTPLSVLAQGLPKSFATPTLSSPCADDEKHGVVALIRERIMMLEQSGRVIAGQAISSVNSIDGVRFTLEDGSWGLVRASSNTPELVTVCESMTSEAQRDALVAFVEALLGEHTCVGPFQQRP